MAATNYQFACYRVLKTFQSTYQKSKTAHSISIIGIVTMSDQLEIVCLPDEIVAGRAFPCPIVVRFPTAALEHQYNGLMAAYLIDLYEDGARHAVMNHESVFEGVRFGNCKLDAPDGFTYVIVYDPDFLNMTRVADNARTGSFRLLFKVELTPWSTGTPKDLGYVYSHRIRVVRPDNVGFQEPWVYETAELMNGLFSGPGTYPYANIAKKHGTDGRGFSL